MSGKNELNAISVTAKLFPQNTKAFKTFEKESKENNSKTSERPTPSKTSNPFSQANQR